MEPNSKKHVVVIGGANIDIVARYQSLQKSFADSHQGSIETFAGGVGRNIAENLVRLGHAVTFISALGDDNFAQSILSSLDLPGLDTKPSQVLPGSRSDTYLSLIDHEGELMHALNQMSLVDHLTPDYLSQYEQLISAADLIIADCNMPVAGLEWLAGLDTRPGLFIDGVSSEKITRLQTCLGRIDGLKCNQQEAATLTGLAETADPEDMMERLLGYGIDTILLSRGQKGVLFHCSGEQGQTPRAEPDGEIISVSGAGDALFAGYIHGMMLGQSHLEALTLGQQAASLTLSCAGAVNPDITLLAKPTSG